MKETNNKPTHRLFIKIIDKNQKPIIDENGKTFVYIKWVEVVEANLGSINNPNPKILEYKYEPIEYEDNKDKT
jgi:hypothetical protein